MKNKYISCIWNYIHHIFSSFSIKVTFVIIPTVLFIYVLLIYVTTVYNYLDRTRASTFEDGNYNRVNREYIIRSSEQQGNSSYNSEKPPCFYEAFDLKTNVSVTQRAIHVQSHPDILHNIHPGGSYSPKSCRNSQKVAIIVPYRDRASHLERFLIHMHHFLQRQLVDYSIFIIEQEQNELFNRGLLFNVGYLMAATKGNYSCLILHDIDLLPTNENLRYQCMPAVVHMRSSAMTEYYPGYFGGVVSISAKFYEMVNGFSNLFYGWGQEDDDFFYRINYLQIPYYRLPSDLGHYEKLDHIPFRGYHKEPIIQRAHLKKHYKKRLKKDGLNSLLFEITGYDVHRLYTWIKVQSNETEYARIFYSCYRKLWICDHKGRPVSIVSKAAEYISNFHNISDRI